MYRPHRLRTDLLVSAILVSALGVASAALAQTAALPASAAQQISELLADKANRTPAQRKISSALIYATKTKLGVPVTASVRTLETAVPLREDGRVEVDILGDIDKAVIEAVQQAGGEPLHVSGTNRVVRAVVPLEALERIAELASVRGIHPAMRAMTHSTVRLNKEKLRTKLLAALDRPHVLPSLRPHDPISGSWNAYQGATNAGSVTSQGSRAMGADRARIFYGVNGAGVKIGVLSDSDDFKEASIASGDLPPDTFTVPGQSGRPGSGEGTAMMEIVHDVAPGAKLFFATAFNGPESFAENIRALRFTYGCDIIVDDIIYFFESPYQDDIIAQAVNDVTADGAFYFSSAGNEGNLNDGTSGMWEGDFKKSPVPLGTLPAGYDVHQFARNVVSDRIEVGGGPVILHWSDPGTLDNPQALNDYDLFVLTPDLRTVAVASTDIQDGDDLPFEFLGYIIPADYQIVVAKKTGMQDVAIRTMIFGGELAIATDGAVYGHAAAAQAYAVGAVDAALAGTGEFPAGPITQVELFSADGPRRLFFKPDGRAFGAVTFKSGDGETRRKPDVSGADGVVTTLPSGSGLNPFFGTSAAAPHAAGVAGLLKSAKPTITESKMRNALTKTATDIEGLGRDRDSGFGIVNAFNALGFIGATPRPFLELNTVTTTPTTGDGDAVIEPGESATMAVNLANIGGGPATQVTGTILSPTPGVTISSNASPWPDIAPGANATNTVPFAFSLSPAAACGTAAVFNLTTNFASPVSPTTFTFAVPTGEPSSTATPFSFTGPRAAIPDANPAGVNISIPVSGVGVVSKVELSIDGATCSSAIGATTVGLDHTWVGDLVMNLTSPSGTTVTLMNRPGGTGNSGNNFCQTVLTDSAVNLIQDITSAGAPWTGSFKPAQPLAAFNGSNGDGNWVLNVADLAAIDTGGVRAFTLRLFGITCTP
jgi:subtilisin-like proprotein convertase family protein